ncbi:MAG: hypothetical protein HY513_05585 [Candidatus Aenigmarchaeota archaeon]|nr:hypothetical protein [Candidatus Aenigmarchaeota archaeon]
MKGSGDSAFTLFTIAFMLICVSILMYVVTNDQIKRSEIVFSDSDLMSAKNTYFIVNRSLGFTWYVSSVQSIFRTHDESIGCGFDDTDISDPEDRLPQWFWYMYDPTKEKTSKEIPRLPTAPNVKYNFKESISVVENPAICYPKKEKDASGTDFEYHIIDYTQKKFSSYLKIPKKFRLSGMEIEIQNPKLEEIKINPGEKAMETLVSQKVSLISASELTKINDKNLPQSTQLKHVNFVFTELDKITETARQVVVNVFLKTSDNLVKEKNEPLFGSSLVFPFDLSKRYLDSASAAVGLSPTESKDKYLEKFRAEMEDAITQIASQAGFVTTTQKTNIGMLELFASHKFGDIRTGAQCVNNLCIDINGNPSAVACSVEKGCGQYTQLIIHYAAEINFSENIQTPYYYHNNYQNTFSPRDFSLEMKAEDYLPAIDCEESPYGDFNANDPKTYNSIVRFYSWNHPKDFICYCRKLWSCDLDLPGLPPILSLKSGGQIPSDEPCRASLQYLDGNDLFCKGGEFVVE